MARLEIDSGAGRFVVTLSRRNLLALLHKLEMPGSAREILNNHLAIDDELVPLELGWILVLRSEDDKTHYSNPARDNPIPGPMHPDTEGFIDRN